MKDDVKKIIYGVLIIFIGVIVVWIGLLFSIGCGFSLDCEAYVNPPQYTPIPTLISAGMPTEEFGSASAALPSCQVSAKTLLNAWVSSEYPETEPFAFTDNLGVACIGDFKRDVQPLFSESNLWYSGAQACTSCHNPNLDPETAAMDLSSYVGIITGSQRASLEAAGKDILGGGDWEDSRLNEQLFINNEMPLGRPDDLPEDGPVIFARNP